MPSGVSTVQHTPVTAGRMREAAIKFLDLLDQNQLDSATFEFSNTERYQWSFLPDRKVPLEDGKHEGGSAAPDESLVKMPEIGPLPGELLRRNGLPLGRMNQGQRNAALTLLVSGLGDRAAAQAKQIITHENILREWEAIENFDGDFIRHPDRYYFTIFGNPAGGDPWAWRASGHHIGLQFAILDRDIVAPLPMFFGANPAEVRHGPTTGFRLLSAEEDLARTLLSSLDTDGKERAVVAHTAPDEIMTLNHQRADPQMGLRGLAYAAMGTIQRQHLVKLVRHYVARADEDVARNEWQRIESAGLDTVTFAWAGPEDRGQQHYYSVMGPKFTIEYDNTQNDGNHVHSVFRDFERDWGEDLLANHYLNAEHH